MMFKARRWRKSIRVYIWEDEGPAAFRAVFATNRAPKVSVRAGNWLWKNIEGDEERKEVFELMRELCPQRLLVEIAELNM